MNLPFAIAPVKAESKYQRVNWSVFKPKEGMIASIKAGGGTLEGTVISVETHNDIVDTVYIRTSNGDSKLVICNGKWQVWGYMVEHNIFFKDTQSTQLQLINPNIQNVLPPPNSPSGYPSNEPTSPSTPLTPSSYQNINQSNY